MAIYKAVRLFLQGHALWLSDNNDDGYQFLWVQHHRALKRDGGGARRSESRLQMYPCQRHLHYILDNQRLPDITDR